MTNYVLSAANAASTFTYLGVARDAVTPIDGVPLGLTAAGELVVKVEDVGAGGDTPVDITVVNAVASSTTHIPAGATSVGVILLTGTGTLGGIALILGLPYNFIGPIKTQTDVVLSNPGTATIGYTA